jgi:hypothetical protein
MQLPSASPTAIFGTWATATALTPVTSSGSEVTVATITTPISVRPRPVRSAITSP